MRGALQNGIPMVRSVILLSGGLDSAVNFKLTVDRGEAVAALTIGYGQRAAAREQHAAAAMCNRFGVPHVCVELPWLGALAETALTRADRELPAPHAETLDDPDHADDSTAVWIPNRNGVFINVAASYAEAAGAGAVVVGFNAEEAGRFPDNTAAFAGAATAALAFSTRNAVRVVCHTMELRKDAILKLGREIEAPFDLLWSCYDGGERHCGRCESCVRLRRAARRAGMEEWLTGQGVLPPAGE